MSVKYLVGDVFDRMAELEDGSVDLILTSPPFLALRSYLPADHPDKAKEIGSEATPADFVDTLLRLTAEWRRLLAPHGTLAVELGDTYAGSGGAGGDYAEGQMRDGQPAFVGSGRTELGSKRGADPLNKGNTSKGTSAGGDWPLAKSLTLTPEAYRFALAYGINPHTGQPSPAGQWRIRNVVRWVRPNPPVGALCVDDQTEALTLDGWKRQDELNDGDIIAAYDKSSDSVRWAPAKFVRYWRENEPMVSIEKRKTSQRLTEEHRCLVRTQKRPEPFVVLAGDLTNSHQTMLAARFDDTPGIEPMSPARAELLGWYITEGTPKYRQALIRQSKTANPQKVERIRQLLNDEGIDFYESDYRKTSGDYGGHILTTFAVKGDFAEWLNLHHKRLPFQYATSWPTPTIRALFRGLVDGDGHRRKAGGILFFQKDRQVVDALQIIATRLGMRCSVTRSDPMDGWQATVGNPDHFESSRWTKVRKWNGEGIPRESYTGTVWCPIVETGFWLARRNGRTFITGNSDKFRPATSELVVAAVSKDRWFDLDAVREPSSYHRESLYVNKETPPGQRPNMSQHTTNPAGAPPLDWWKISPKGYAGAHYAVWPAELCVKPIQAMCPREVCRECGLPRERIVEPSEAYAENFRSGEGSMYAHEDREQKARASARPMSTKTAEYLTLGWSDCGHDNYRPGLVLDPFGGTGTTLMVAHGHGRDAIGIDLDERNLELARERVGPMFLEEA